MRKPDKDDPMVERGVRNKYVAVAMTLTVSMVLAFVLLHAQAFAAVKWTGVDESVIEKMAKEHGREAKEPLIDTDKGDLLLFVFLLAGAIGGFAAGYYWRILTEKKTDPGAKGSSH